MKSYLLAFIVCLVLLSPGCFTCIQASTSGPAIFGGTRALIHFFNDFQIAAWGSDWGWSATILFLAICDIPLSLTLDAVLLPATLPNEIIQGGINTR